MNLRANLLCILGAVLGLLCLAVPVLTVTLDYHSLGHAGTMEYSLYMSSSELVGIQIDPPILQPAEFLVALIAFFGGVALAFVTPLGGVSMAVGIVDYYRVLSSEFDAFTNTFSGPGRTVTSISYDAAFYVGILATVVVLVSSVLPLGPGYSEMYNPWPFGRLRLKERLLVWGWRKKS